MPNEWENGSAARDVSYDESYNPFAPINYAQRLQDAGKKPSAPSGGMNYAPGQLYGYPAASQPAQPEAPAWEPPMYDANAWQMETPEFSSVPMPQDAQVGALYNTALFQHQQTAVMPSVGDETPFADRAEFDFSLPPWPEEEAPQFEPAMEEPSAPAEKESYGPWRDPFTPAAPKEEKAPKAKKEPQKVQKVQKAQPAERPRIRMGRLVALILSIGMLVFCVVTITALVMDLVKSEKQMEDARSAYLEQNHTELHNGAARVDLLPAGQTYVPTATPSATPFVARPTPTPIIPIREAAVISLGRGSSGAESTEEPVTETALRTRTNIYPKNPLRNIMPSLTELIKENSDIIGRLVIPGVLDEIVVQRNNTYYLTRTYLGTTSEGGSVFADEGCQLRNPPENLLLRGQGSVPGKTFAPLWQYVSGGASFVSTAATARLTSLYEEESYVLFAVIVADTDPSSSGYFNYASHPSFTTDEDMLRYVQDARAHSLYQFDVDVQPSDRLLTLSTIGSDSCLVLMYRMARDGENY